MISEYHFLQIYKDIPSVLSLRDVLYTPVKDEEDLHNRLHSKLFRLNNIYSIVDKEKNLVTYKMNYVQHLLHANKLRYNRVIVLKSRQTGITTYSIIDSIDDILTNTLYKAGIIANNLYSAKRILDTAKGIVSRINPSIYEMFNTKYIRNNREEIAFSNDSNLSVSVKFRSATLHRLHISELGPLSDSDPLLADEVLKGSMNAIHSSRPVIIESTATGDNLFKRQFMTYYNMKEEERTELDMYSMFISWLDDDTANLYKGKLTQTDDQKAYFSALEHKLGREIPDSKRRFWIAKYRSMDDKAGIYQEYPSTPDEAFTSSHSSTYYNYYFMKYVENNHRIVGDLYNPDYPVYFSMDIGVSDCTVIMFYQYYDGFFRLINNYRNNGYALNHYIDVIKLYYPAIHTAFLPHDSVARDKTTLQSIDSMVGEHYNVIVLERGKVEDGREHVRRALSRMYIDSKCEYAISCFRNYSQKIDKKTGRGAGKHKRDDYTDGADAIRYMVQSERFLSDKPIKTIEEDKSSQDYRKWI